MAIDTTKIVQAVMQGSQIRESKGIIPLFGVYLSFISIQYYNQLCYDFEKKLDQGDKARDLLVRAAQECGYATFQGIRNSWEWDEIVDAMLESKEDQIAGFAAVALAFGWGDIEVKQIIPGQKLNMRVTDSYEASGYLERYGTATSGKCYMLRGVAAAFMDLTYGADYPDGCFDFVAAEPHCRAKGDPYCEFVARKSFNRNNA